MMTPNPLTAALLACAFVNAVPSDTAFHPAGAVCDLKEADLAGSGRERPWPVLLQAASTPETPDKRNDRDWRAMAQRCRSLADWHTGEARAALLRLAEAYEQRAKDADEGRG